ncbi:hypothetical protein ACFO3I_00655 [Rheinheimera marina]|uniref:EF-hand domain-containing protein n=1 Tax=Rheinheimera marina TaxID=1774958 RepID=A0ABV9JFS9_9GAMM
MAHQWRFFRSGGFDQVRLDKIEDWQHLHELDPKLWAALSCPVKGLEFDERTLSYLDSDADGKVRIDEVRSAVRWALSVLKHPAVLLSGDELPLSAIDDGTEQGRKLLASAQRMLTNLGKAEASALTVADTADMASIFPPDQLNGDGVITAALSSSEPLTQLITAIHSCGWQVQDRSGMAGIDQPLLDQFVAAGQAYRGWLDAADAVSAVAGEQTAELYQLVQALDAKVADFFTRCQLAAYDANATEPLNAALADYAALSRQLLNADSADASHLPLARISAEALLPLTAGVHPHWADKLARLAALAKPVWKTAKEINASKWQQLKDTLKPYADWKAAEPQSPVASLDALVLRACLEETVLAEATALIAQDLARQSEAESVLEVDKLIRYQRYLRDLLHNFVNLQSFYSLKQPAIFQNGRLYIDGRSCDLCIEVHDAGKHAKVAGLSGAYLLYMDCSRKGSAEKKSIVAAMTAGDAGNLMVGRNGVYYDAKGQDWDATVSRIVENPISIREAFFTPYRRIGRMISDQIQKFAASKDKEIETKSAAGVGDAAKVAETAAKPAAPFDVAKFAGIFAAIGLALGALGTALATVFSSFLGLSWWQMPLALAGIALMISGPAMLLAWFKLRERNLAPLLDANGWALNTNAKLSIPFGTRLTALAQLPAGSSRSMADPYENKSHIGLYLTLLVLACLAGWAWQAGLFARWLG